MKFSLAMVAALLAVTSQHFLTDALPASNEFEQGVDDLVDDLLGDCGCYKILGRFDNRCNGNSGTKLIGCRRSNRFVQCLNESCSIQTCSAGELWNSTAHACSPCPAGQHVDAHNKTCVCNNGTTASERGHDGGSNCQTKTCIPCPTNSTQDVDSCYCSLPLIKDEVSNACRACPAGATLKDHKRCQCKNESLFWNPSTWQCSECPGVWQDSHDWLFDEKVCVCPGNNSVFVRRNVSCYACPSPAQASQDGEDCECPLDGQRFDWKTLACVCEGGRVLNENQTACEWIDTDTTTASDSSTVTGSADSSVATETATASSAVTATSEDGSTATDGSSTTTAGGSTTTVGGSTTTVGGSTTTAGGSTTTAGGSTTTAGWSTTTAGGSTTTVGGSTTTAGGSTTTVGGSTTTEGGSTATA